MTITKQATHNIRTTLYLTENNKKWLETQPRGQRTQIINEAIKRIKEEEEGKAKKHKLLKFIENIKPIKSLIPSEKMIRMIRDGKEEELDQKLKILRKENERK